MSWWTIKDPDTHLVRMEVFKNVNHIRCLITKLIEIPPRIVVFPRVDDFAYISGSQTSKLGQLQLGCNLLRWECEMPCCLANPIWDMDPTPISFLFQRLLVASEPRVMWTFICGYVGLILSQYDMLLFPWCQSWQNWFKGFVIVLTHKTENDSKKHWSHFEIGFAYCPYCSICARNFWWAITTSGHLWPSW